MKSNTNIKLDVKKLLGFRILASSNDSFEMVSLASKVGNKIGTKLGGKAALPE